MLVSHAFKLGPTSISGKGNDEQESNRESKTDRETAGLPVAPRLRHTISGVERVDQCCKPARRRPQGKQNSDGTPAMLVLESRILQVTIFGTLQSNLNSLDFSLVLPDVMTIADEVDAQLTQSMDSFMKTMRKLEAA